MKRQWSYHPGQPPGFRTSCCGYCRLPGHTIEQCPMYTVRCDACGKFGHAETECPQVHCYQCKQQGHTGKDCPFNVCRRCRQNGHLKQDCPLQSQYSACSLCRQYGHVDQSCPNLQFQPSTDVCSQCLLPGHSAQRCHFVPRPQKPSIAWCNSCQQSGHGAVNCPQIPSRHGLQNSTNYYQHGQQQGHNSQGCQQIPHGPSACCSYCRGFGHGSQECPHITSQSDGSSAWCTHCQDHGHGSQNCPRSPHQSQCTIIQCDVYQHVGDTYNYSVEPVSSPSQPTHRRCNVCNQTDHTDRSCPSLIQSQQQYRQGPCTLCYRYDHTIQNCPVGHQPNTPDFRHQNKQGFTNTTYECQETPPFAGRSNGFLQTVQPTEEFPKPHQPYCDNCGLYGHNTENCRVSVQSHYPFPPCGICQQHDHESQNCPCAPQQQVSGSQNLYQTPLQQPPKAGDLSQNGDASAQKQPQMPIQLEDFWRDCVHEWMPDLHSETYFVPPLHFNKVPYDVQDIAGHSVLVPVLPYDPRNQTPAKKRKVCSNSLTSSSSSNSISNSCDDQSIPSLQGVMFPDPQATPLETPRVQQNDIVDDQAQQILLKALNNLANARKPKEPMVILSQLQFGNYLNRQCFAASYNACLPRPGDLGEKYEDGDFDILITHRKYGLIVGEVKSIGGNRKLIRDLCDAVEKRVRDKAIPQLYKAEAVLKHLASDLATVNVTKTVILPYVDSRVLEQALGNYPQLEQDLCQCLGVTGLQKAVARCLCADQLSDVSKMVTWLNALQQDVNMTPEIYERLVARLCGPATTVEVATVTSPRLQPRSIGQGIAAIGWMISQLTLFPAQVDLVNRADPLVYLCGPPGTGKSIVLVLVGLFWMSQGHDVYVLSTNTGSRAVTFLIKEQLEHSYQQQHQNSGTGSCPTVHRLYFSFDDSAKCKKELKRAVSELSHKAGRKGGLLHVIVDEAGRPARGSGYGKAFKAFCSELLTLVPRLHLWAASVCDDEIPVCLHKEELTVPLRCPPTVISAIEESRHLKSHDGTRKKYSSRTTPAPTDGPKIRYFHHKRQDGHTTAGYELDCVSCGNEIANMLKELGVGVKGCLQYRDVLVVCPLHDNRRLSGTALRSQNIPFKIILPHSSDSDMRKMALAEDDEVIVTDWEVASGLERRVVIGTGTLQNGAYTRAYGMSRCTSQLVWIDPPKEDLSSVRDKPKEAAEDAKDRAKAKRMFRKGRIREMSRVRKRIACRRQRSKAFLAHL